MQLKAPLALRSLGLRVIPQETAAPLGGDRGSEPNPFCPPASTFVFYAAAVRDLAGKGAQPDLHRQKAAPPGQKEMEGSRRGVPLPQDPPALPLPIPPPLPSVPPTRPTPPRAGRARHRRGPRGRAGRGDRPRTDPSPSPGCSGAGSFPSPPAAGVSRPPLEAGGDLTGACAARGGGAAPRSPWGMYRRVSDPGKEPGPWGATCVPLGSRLYSPRKLSAKIWGKTCLC